MSFWEQVVRSGEAYPLAPGLDPCIKRWGQLSAGGNDFPDYFDILWRSIGGLETSEVGARKSRQRRVQDSVLFNP